MDGFGEVYVYVYNFLMILYKAGDIVEWCASFLSYFVLFLSFAIFAVPPDVESQ